MIKNLLFLLLIHFYYLNSNSQSIVVNEICTLSDTLIENSGLFLDQNNRIWLHNDGGNLSEIYRINNLGQIDKIIHIKNATNIDWESITSDNNGHVFIADIGNNDNTRQNLSILKIPDPSNIVDDSIIAEKIFFSYEDQTAFPPAADQMNFDAEAIIHYNQHLYIFTKNRCTPFDGYTYMYKIPDSAGTYIAIKIDSLFLGNGLQEIFQVTDAAIDSNNNHLVLLGYYNIWFINNFSGDQFLSGTLNTLSFPSLSQKEAITWVSSDSLLMSDEFFNNTGKKLYGIKLIDNTEIQISTTPQAQIFPNPAKEYFSIKYNTDINKVIIRDLLGKIVIQENKHQNINIKSLNPGLYTVQVYSSTIFSLKLMIK